MAPTESSNSVAGGEHANRRDAPRGWFDSGEHLFPLRVYYEDTDAAGIVYYANYLKFAERARTEMIRSLGFEHRQMMTGAGLNFAVRSCEAEYLQPARLDDELTVATRIESVGGASLRLTQRVVKTVDSSAQAQVATLRIRLACLDKSQRPVRIPAEIRDALATFLPA